MGVSNLTKTEARKLMDREGRGHTGSDWSTALYEQFDILPNATQSSTVSQMWDVTGAGTPTCAFATDGGGITIGTTAADGGADNDAAALWPLSTGAWSVARKPDGTRKHRLAAKVKTGASIASYCIQWGLKLTDTAVYKTDADQVLIVFDTDAIDIDPGSGYADVAANSTTFYVIISKGGTDYAINTGITVAAATEYDFAIEIGTDGRPHVYINGKEISLTGIDSAPYAAMTTTASLLPTFRVLERVISSTKTATIRWVQYLGK